MITDQWEKGPIIGHGSSATVYSSTNRISGEKLAVKVSDLSKSSQLRREKSILSSLKNSPRIISYRGFRATEETLELFMELAPGGSLSDEIRRRGGPLSESPARIFAREILLGLEFIHREGIVHCDLKCSNVLVTGEGLKIADFGCARMRHVDGGDSFCGTPAYMAPEVARGEAQGFEADIWAFGCTVLEMLTGRVSWLGISDPVSVLYRVGFLGSGLEIPSWVSEEGRDFLGKCLRRERSERWSASELLGHPFVSACGPSFFMDSPRSVFELGDSSGLDSGSDDWESGSETPSERIRRLTCWGCDDDINDWACDLGWVMVRGENWAEIVGPEIETMSGIIDIREGLTLIRNCENGNEGCCSSSSSSGASNVRDWKRGSLIEIMPSKCTKGRVLLCGTFCINYNELYFVSCPLSILYNYYFFLIWPIKRA